MLSILASISMMAASPTIVVSAPSGSETRLTDRQLETIRGGLLLPNGLDISLGIDIQTRVNGLLVLHTIYASEGPNSGIRVFTDGSKTIATPPTAATAVGQQVIGTPVLVFDRSPTGTTIIPTGSVPATTVNLVNGDPSNWQSGEGQTQIPVVPNGNAVAAAPGAIAIRTSPAGAVVALTAADFQIQQLIGRATGVVIANTANDRAIETVSAINVDLQGVSPGLLAGLFMAQRAALEGLITR